MIIVLSCVNEPKIPIFEIFMKIGHYVFVKIYILEQNSAGGRFLRFVASPVSYAIFKLTAVKIITSANYLGNLGMLPHVVCT